MALLSQVIQKDPVRGMIYGPSGCGKTTLLGLLAQYEEFRPIYFFDFDLRIQSLRARLDPQYWDYIDADPYRDQQVQGESVVYMMAKIDKLVPAGFKTAIVDSATFCMKAIMSRVLALDGQKPPTFTPQLQHYMAQISTFEELVQRMCGSPKLNVFFTAHEDTNKDEITGRLFKGLDLTGKAANRIPGYFNELWHCEVLQQSGKESEFRVRTRSDMLYPARTTYRSLQAVEKQEEIWPRVLKERQAGIGTVSAPSTGEISGAASPAAKFPSSSTGKPA